MFRNLLKYLGQERIVLGIYTLIAIGISIQKFFGHHNNYLVYKFAFKHLLNKSNLHIEYPSEYGDIFLYHPSFSIFFAPISILPDFLGLLLFTSISSLSVFFAVKNLPVQNEKKIFIWWFILFQLITTLQNIQTNAIVAALLLFCFISLEKQKQMQAGLFAASNFFIKIYGGAAALLLPLYCKKIWRQLTLYVLFFFLFSILPSFFIGFGELKRLYTDWFNVLQSDHAVNYGVSLIGLMHAVFPTLYEKFPAIDIQVAGLFILVITYIWVLVRIKHASNPSTVRILMLAYLMLWVIVFNHTAESNTQIISVLGACIWFVSVPKSRQHIVLICFVMLLTCLSPTDLFPKPIWRLYVKPLYLQALPILMVWIQIHFDLFKTLKADYTHE